MPRAVKPKPIQELVSYELLTALIVVLEEHASDPFAQALLKQLKHGQQLWKEGMHEEWQTQSQRANEPRPDVKTLKKPVVGLTRTVVDLFKQSGLGDKVVELKKKYPEVEDLAPHLIDAGRKAKLGLAVSVMNALEEKLEPLVEASARVAKGGHPVFDDKVASLATRLWVIVDNAFDGLRIIFRTKGVYTHPIFAQEPTVKSPLRPVVGPPKSATPPARRAKKTEKAAKDAKGAKGANKGDAKNAGGKGGSDTQPPQPSGSSPGNGATGPGNGATSSTQSPQV